MASCLDFANRLVNVEKVMLGTFCAGRDAGNQRTEAFKDSKLMFCFGNIAELKTQGTIQYKPVQFPTPEENYERYNTINEYTMQTIPVSANYPVKDLAYFWMDRCCVWDENAGDAYYELDYEEKIEELYATAFLTREDAEYMVECGKKLKGEIVSPADGLGSLAIWNLFNPVMEGSKSVAQVIEENAQSMQASIDKNLNSYIDEKK